MRMVPLICASILVGGLSSALLGNETAPPPSTPNATPIVDPVEVSARYQQTLQQPLYHETAEIDPHAEVRDWLSRWFKPNWPGVQPFRVYGRDAALRLAGDDGAGRAHRHLLALCFRAVDAPVRPLESPSVSPRRRIAFRRALGFVSIELQRALSDRDWRRAWQATWRNFLFRLEQAKLVASDRSRTNREYLAQMRELPPSALHQLNRMVSDYDRLIYGDRPIGEDDWKSFQRTARRRHFR